MSAARPWRILIDTGGTFTDAVGIDPAGAVRRAKVLSTSALRGTLASGGRARLRLRPGLGLPAGFLDGFGFRLLEGEPPPRGRRAAHRVLRHGPDPLDLAIAPPLPAPPRPGTPFEVSSREDAPILAARLLTRCPPPRPLPALEMRLATTLATNALLTRSFPPIVLFVTRGFRDLLVIGTQQRPDLFARAVVLPAPLAATVVEVDERLAADGSVVRRLDAASVLRHARRLRRAGFGAAAVALLHADVAPRHERIVERLLKRAGFPHVARASLLSPFMRVLPRAQTAVVEAALAPVLRGFLDRVAASASGRGRRSRVHVMTSAGGLVRAAAVHPKDTLLSGPAGGVVGAARAGARSGFRRVLAFDMGGTSTDVARVDGDFEYRFEHEVGGAHLLAPALAIESVAAGGGSVCWFDGDRLRVGPRSAGAQPGPACYGAGGPLTLTDVNLLLGRLDPARFGVPVLEGPARRAAEALRRGSLGGRRGAAGLETLLAGLLAIADERMAEAIREVTVRRGHDPAEFALVAFGGAGGQHACAVAAHLGIRTVVVPDDAGLLSARGLGAAVLERFAERQVLAPLGRPREDRRLRALLEALARRAAAAVAREGVAARRVVIRRRVVSLRFAGQETTVDVEDDGRTPLRTAFVRRHRALYGHHPGRRPVEVVALRVVASSAAPPARRPRRAPREGPASPATARRAFLDGAWRRVPVYDRARLRPGDRLAGPALVFEAHGATCVPGGWSARLDEALALVLRRAARRDGGRGRRQPAGVRLELFTHRFRAIAQAMGERLRRTAVSTNIKERLDFSCAVLDAGGGLVVNAPHIPVHLGGLGLCVRGVARALRLRPGDVAVTNHPAHGGSHLPDLTVVTPVFAGGARGGRAPALLGYVASRAHHAEIGGTRPGSMPAGATRLVQEGVVIPPTLVVARGAPQWRAVARLLARAPHPSRAPADNLADLRAAVAANHAGAGALAALARREGSATVARFMRALQALAARRMRAALRRLPSRRLEARERLDDGSPLRVAIGARRGSAVFDFTGSAGIHPGNLNATPAIVRSAVMYVLRLLVEEPLPLNEGLLRPVRIVLPRGLLNPDFGVAGAEAPAIVGGNVETSQRLVDTMLKALRLCACSQGTMNNVLFGSARFGYYETVCGGAGASPGHDGASAVHTHMTNTRMTDPEVIERRYPVRVERFAVRRGSGGAGAFRGGDGVAREIVFLAPLVLSLLGEHRIEAPYGMAGGLPGAVGRQRVVRASGDVVPLPGAASLEVGRGDRLVLETPGGGGWGAPRRRRRGAAS